MSLITGGDVVTVNLSLLRSDLKPSRNAKNFGLRPSVSLCKAIDNRKWVDIGRPPSHFCFRKVLHGGSGGGRVVRIRERVSMRTALDPPPPVKKAADCPSPPPSPSSSDFFKIPASHGDRWGEAGMLGRERKQSCRMASS